ncbi:MAG: nickel ABC transporter permease [Deinococcota bacterium]
MLQYIIRRILRIIPVMFGVSIIVFGIMYLTPGDPALLMLGENAPEEQYAALREELGLNEPFVVQYGLWLGRVVQLDFGRSIRSNRPVLAEIRSRYPATVELAIVAILLAVLIGVPIGVFSATRPASVADNVATVGALSGLAMPVFWQGLMAILIFSVWLEWLPASGRSPTGLRLGSWQFGHWKEYILPALTLGTSAVAAITRMMRSTMLETIDQDYVRTAKAKGLLRGSVLYHHALRNALLPVVTVVGLQFGNLLAGAVITETIFSWPGIGSFAVGAIRAKDFPVVQGVVMTFALTYALVNLLVDVLYAYIDPRIRTRYSN